MIPAVLPTYARADIAFERGEGAYLWSTDGRRFLDFGSGVAVTNLGHCHPRLVAALTEQAGRLWHVSNHYRIPGQEAVAATLVANSFADTVFFCNSGAEANECAIKMARHYHFARGDHQRSEIVCATGAFHGRTLGTLAAGGQEKYLEGFEPRLPGFRHVPFGNMNLLRDALSERTAAILLEPVQGESGVIPGDPEYLQRVRAAADEFGALLIFDEVQTGIGRTGKFFAHEWAGVTPDILAVAKGLGGGFPVGACLATEEACSGMVPGVHGTTFGGNLLAMAIGNAVIAEIGKPEFLEDIRAKSLLMKQKLAGLVDSHPDVFEGVRGEGLLLGVKCRVPSSEVLAAMRAEKLLCVGAGDNVIRFAPPLTVTPAELEEAVRRADAAAGAVESMKKA